MSLASLALLLLVPCASPRFTANPPTLAVEVSGTGSLSAAVTQNCFSDTVATGTVGWVSLNTAVATVAGSDRTATVTGVGVGSTEIVATYTGDVTLADTVHVDVIAADTTPCTPTSTTLCPGDDLQAKVTAAGSGASLTFGAGTFPQATIIPLANQTFTGAGVGQTILDGTRTLTGWTLSGSNYYASGQTQDVFYKKKADGTASAECDATHPLCYQSEQLWVNDHLYIPVASLGAIGAGKWYFDKSADRIYLPFNPADSTVVTSVTPYAIAAGVVGVTIQDLTVQRYATSNGYGAIGYQGSGPNWTVTRVEAKENHGVGIKAASGWTVTGVNSHHNGQMGYACTGTTILFSLDTFAFNNTAGNTGGTAGEAGGGKCTRTSGLTIRHSYSHDNAGPGLWTDIDNIHTHYDTNTVADNDWRGIFHEISYDAVIVGNTVTGNGFNLPFVTPAATDGAGILISNSPNVEVYGNTVTDNKHGIAGLETDRGSGRYGPYNVTNLSVHDNTVTQTDAGRAGGIAKSADADSDPYTVAANNVWADNTYTLGASTRFRWSNADKTWAQWTALGQDAGSTQSGQ